MLRYLCSKESEPGSEPLLAWKRANWAQETCLLIQATLLRTASSSFIGDFTNFSTRNTSTYLTFLSTAELIMMCWVFHLFTLGPPVGNVFSCALSPTMRFYIEYSNKGIYICVVLFGFFR